MTLKYLLIIDFPKFEPVTAAEMALCGNLGPKCQNFKILQKKFFEWAVFGGGTIFPRSPRTMGNEKKF